MLSLLNEPTFQHVMQRKADLPQSGASIDTDELLTRISYKVSPQYLAIYRDARSKLDTFLHYLKQFLKSNRYGINFVDTIVISSETDLYFDRSISELPKFVVLIPFRRPPNSRLVRLNDHIEFGYCAIMINQDSQKDELSKLRMSGQNPENKRFLSKSGSVKVLRDVLVPNWPTVLRACGRVLRGFQGQLKWTEIKPGVPAKLTGEFTVQMLAKNAIEEGFIEADKVADAEKQIFQYEFSVEFAVAMSVEHETGFKDAYLTTRAYFSTDEHAFTENLWHYSYKPIETRIMQIVCKADRMKRMEAVTCILYIAKHHPLFRNLINQEHVRSALLYSVDYDIDTCNYQSILENKTLSAAWQRQSLTHCFISLMAALLPFVRKGTFPHFFIAKLDLFRFSKFEQITPTVRQLYPVPPIPNLKRAEVREHRLNVLQMVVANWIRSPASLGRDITELIKQVQLVETKPGKPVVKPVSQEDVIKSFITLINEGDPLYRIQSLVKSRSASSVKSRSARSGDASRSRISTTRQTARSTTSRISTTISKPHMTPTME